MSNINKFNKINFDYNIINSNINNIKFLNDDIQSKIIYNLPPYLFYLELLPNVY